MTKIDATIPLENLEVEPPISEAEFRNALPALADALPRLSESTILTLQIELPAEDWIIAQRYAVEHGGTINSAVACLAVRGAQSWNRSKQAPVANQRN